MKHCRSQIPVSPLIEPSEGGLCSEKVPQSGSEEEPIFPQVRGKTAELGDNVYVLDFKHFLPVRKSRCKGMFFCLEDLTDFFLLFLRYFLLGVVKERQSLALHHLSTQRINMQVATKCVAWHSFKIHHVGKACFLIASDTLKFVRRTILKKDPTIKSNIS